MNYREQNAPAIWGNGPGGEATKVSKAPFVPFVAPYLAPSRQIQQGSKHGD